MLKPAHPSGGDESSWAPPRSRSACACLPRWACSIDICVLPPGRNRQKSSASLEFCWCHRATIVLAMCCTRTCLIRATGTRHTRAAGNRLSANGISGILAVLVAFNTIEVCRHGHLDHSVKILTTEQPLSSSVLPGWLVLGVVSQL